MLHSYQMVRCVLFASLRCYYNHMSYNLQLLLLMNQNSAYIPMQ